MYSSFLYANPRIPYSKCTVYAASGTAAQSSSSQIIQPSYAHCFVLSYSATVIRTERCLDIRQAAAIATEAALHPANFSPMLVLWLCGARDLNHRCGTRRATGLRIIHVMCAETGSILDGLHQSHGTIGLAPLWADCIRAMVASTQCATATHAITDPS